MYVVLCYCYYSAVTLFLSSGPLSKVCATTTSDFWKEFFFLPLIFFLEPFDDRFEGAIPNPKEHKNKTCTHHHEIHNVFRM